VNASTIVGIIGSAASMSSFAPQAWRIIKTRKTEDLAAPAYTLTVIAFAAWTAYGILLGEWPLIVTNAVCLVLSAFILMMKLLPRRSRDAVADAIDPDKD
jgi:MtN3 and saliva related transmembrane protein